MELKDLLAEFDIKAEDVSKLTVDDVRKQRDEKWIGRAVVLEDEDTLKKLTGKITGSVTTTVKGAFKELGVEFKPEEIQGKKFEEIIQLGKERVNESFKELREKATHGNDKKLTDLQAQFEAEKKKRTETEEVLKNSQSLLEQKEKEFQGNMKIFKLNHKLAEIKAKIPFSESADDFKKRGFDAVFNENYKVDLGENDELVLMDKTGNRVKSATGGAFISFEDGYKAELDKAGMLKKNNAGQGQTKPYTPPSGGGQGGGQGPIEYQLPAAALEHAARLKAGVS